jgi:uncharacterized Ntn-hydrolase superfamily protein
MRFDTFSIVACDLEERAWGVAVASKFLAAGALVSWAQAGAGAVATQALAKVGYGPDGLALLAQGKTASETLAALLRGDPGAADRQVGIVDRRGGAAAHTGERCFDWAGHRIGEGFTCQGNILTGPETLEAMAEAFAAAHGELADRLVAALSAGEAAGGDRRGKQSAAVLVVRPGGGYGGDTDRYLDLRVDDDPEPVRRLQHLVASHHVFFGSPSPEGQLTVDDAVARELQTLLKRQGYYDGEVHGRWDEPSKRAFWALVGNENLEERWHIDRQPDKIDPVVLNYLRERFGDAG